MLYTFVVCLLLTHQLEWVQSKAWPQQYDRQNYSNPSHGQYYGQNGFGSVPLATKNTTATAKPIYPTLYPNYNPTPNHYQPQGNNGWPGSPNQPNFNQNGTYNQRPNGSSPNNGWGSSGGRGTPPPQFNGQFGNTFPTRQPFGSQNPHHNLTNALNNPNYHNNHRPNNGNGTYQYRPFPTPSYSNGGNQYGNQNGNQYGNQFANQNGYSNGNQNGNQFGNQNGYQNGNQNGYQNGNQFGNQNGYQNGNHFGNQNGN